MVRVKGGYISRRRHKKVLKRAKGFRGSPGTLFRQGKQAVYHALRHATVGRKLRKRDMRALWITRIGSVAHDFGLSYSRLIAGLKKAKIQIDRKNLANLAVSDKNVFEKIVDLAKLARK